MAQPDECQAEKGKVIFDTVPKAFLDFLDARCKIWAENWNARSHVFGVRTFGVAAEARHNSGLAKLVVLAECYEAWRCLARRDREAEWRVVDTWPGRSVDEIRDEEIISKSEYDVWTTTPRLAPRGTRVNDGMGRIERGHVAESGRRPRGAAS